MELIKHTTVFILLLLCRLLKSNTVAELGISMLLDPSRAPVEKTAGCWLEKIT